MLWEVDILPKNEQLDCLAGDVVEEATELGIVDDITVQAARGFLLDGELAKHDAERIAIQLLADAVVEEVRVGQVDDPLLAAGGTGEVRLVHILPKRGVTDPVAESARRAISDMAVPITHVRTLRKYWIAGVTDDQLKRLCGKVLANSSIEQVVMGPLSSAALDPPTAYTFRRVHVPMAALNDNALTALSTHRHLYLSLEEMHTIQAHFAAVGRDPTDVELETIAQTWSEHCSHKTLKGRIDYQDENGRQAFDNLLKETVFAATVQIRSSLGTDDWCVSVFEDNAGIVCFDDEFHVCFKVETHNHPSAIEPYGGANTGIGGVIRDTLGTGLGAKPVCNTDVFCFAAPDYPAAEIPAGVLHPRRALKGVVSGVRDYGNRMGIPTVNGTVCFDDRYLANPLVYCGNVGMIPVGKVDKSPQPGDLIVVIGGATGRDGIHGATFSSAELTSDSDDVSGGAVQIGNAITEKMLADVLMAARDQDLYRAVTDCGAGGLSSAIGEMGEHTGAVVQLDRVPLKYAGLTYAEIWISEAQERMVLAVPHECWPGLSALCSSEDVAATIIGEFTDNGRLVLEYGCEQVGDLEMQFLHHGRPPVVRQAQYRPPGGRSAAAASQISAQSSEATNNIDFNKVLQQMLGAWNVASKEWIIRQYDHEVQAGSVVKPLVGAANDGPGDAAVVRPRLDSWRGLVVSCGMNPHYGDWDTYHMAASAIDEAVRNCVAVGADPARIAILDNFCWGNTNRPETLGSLVRAALACRDVAFELGTPFISGKDSLNNEFSYADETGRHTISIPPTLLISALGQIEDVRQSVTMDLKQAGNVLYIVGLTRNELGGSHLGLVTNRIFADPPAVVGSRAKNTFAAMHAAMRRRLVRACHDLSEGGLAVALAEMAFAGNLGASVELGGVPHDVQDGAQFAELLLFSESNSRFICELPREHCQTFAEILKAAKVPCAAIGEVDENCHLTISLGGEPLISADCAELKKSWQDPLRL